MPVPLTTKGKEVPGRGEGAAAEGEAELADTKAIKGSAGLKRLEAPNRSGSSADTELLRDLPR